MPKTLMLTVALTPQEHLKLALEMSTVIRAAEAKEEEKKNVNAALTAEVNALWSHIHDLNGPVSSGKVERDVEIEERMYIEAGEVEIWRLDTTPPTLHSKRPLDAGERQLKNGLERPPGEREAPPAGADEQHAATPEDAERMRDERLREERLDRARLQVAELAEKILVLETGREDGDTYRASIAVEPGCPWTEILEALGGKAYEARNALIGKCVSLIAASYAEVMTARQERILTKFGLLLSTHTMAVNNDTGRFVAKLETETSVMEAEGADAIEALAQLRVKMIAWLEGQEDEIERLAAEQAKDQARTPMLLKVPKNGKAKAAKPAKDKGGVEMTITVGAVDYQIIISAVKDGGYSAECKAVPGSFAEGVSVDEVCAGMAAAIGTMVGNGEGGEEKDGESGEGPLAF